MTPAAVTRREAIRRGATVRQLAGPAYQRLFHNLYVPGGAIVRTADRARAVLKLSPPGSFISHHTAATLWNGRPPEAHDIHVSIPAGTRSRRRGVRSHRACGPSTVLGGVRISTPANTFLELASVGVGLVELVVVGDALVAAELLTPAELLGACAIDRRKGVRVARRAAALVRIGVDSGPESRLRMLIVLAGLPEPAVNHILRDDRGGWVRRFDLSFPALKIIIEYDGRHHATDLQQWNRDLRRREELERGGWTFVVITADALFNHPEDTLARIWAVLADRGAELPPRRATAWSHHFGR